MGRAAGFAALARPLRDAKRCGNGIRPPGAASGFYIFCLREGAVSLHWGFVHRRRRRPAGGLPARLHRARRRPPRRSRGAPPRTRRDYLELFISRSLEGEEYEEGRAPRGRSTPARTSSTPSSSTPTRGLDPESGIGLVRLTSAVVPPEGFTVRGDDATLMCYSLSGEGDAVTDGRALRCRKYDCVWLDCSRRVQLRAGPGQALGVRLRARPGPYALQALREPLRRAGTWAAPCSSPSGAGTRFRSLIWQLLSPRTRADAGAGQHVRAPAAEPLRRGRPRAGERLGPSR